MLRHKLCDSLIATHYRDLVTPIRNESDWVFDYLEINYTLEGISLDLIYVEVCVRSERT